MGSRDYRWRERKKPKKETKKISTADTILPPPTTIEVIKKGKKEQKAKEE